MLDWTKVKAGDPIEPHVVGYRVWRYRLGPPLCLLSWCLGSSELWPTDAPFQSDKEPNLASPDGSKMSHGIHAYLTRKELQRQFGDLASLLCYRGIYSEPDNPARWDGVVAGTVTLWGISVEGPRGYRAQFARIASFDEAHGTRADEALERLRGLYLHEYG